MNRYQNNGYRNNNRFNEYQNSRNSNTLMYAIIAIVILALGVGIYMNVIKIPGFNMKNTFIPSTIMGRSRDKKSQQKTPDEIPSEQPKKPTGSKTDEIPCPYDCSSIPGSSCINGKCTDPYLHLQ